ncbi:hypothetical protein HID58_038145, partial [Brassica napus]
DLLYAKTQRIVLLIDLNPLILSPDSNQYLAVVISAAEKLLSFPPLSASLFSFKFFISSLSSLLSSSKLSALSIPSSKLSFDLPTPTLVSLRRAIDVVKRCELQSTSTSTSPRGVNVAASLRQIVYDYAWEPVVFDYVNDLFDDRDIHLSWIDVSFGERSERELKSEFFDSGVRGLGWGHCSTDSLVFGSLNVPFGLIYPTLGVSPKVSTSHKFTVQVSLEIADIDGKPMECKCGELEFSSSEISNWRVLQWISQESDQEKEQESGFWADRVLQILEKETGERVAKKSSPIWQILLSYLYREGYSALVSLTKSDGSARTGILKPFTFSSALILVFDSGVSPQTVDNEDSRVLQISERKPKGCSLSVASNCDAQEDVQTDPDDKNHNSSEGTEKTTSLPVSEEDIALSGNRISVRQENDTSVTPLESSDIFFASLPSKIKQGIESEEIDLAALAERLVKSCLLHSSQRLEKDCSCESGSHLLVTEELTKMLLKEPKDLVAMFKKKNSSSTASEQKSDEASPSSIIREYELQILFRMEILKSEIGLGSEESVTQKFAKQICMLLKAIQCKLDGGFFSDWSLDKYVDKIIKASDEDLEDSFMNNEGSSQSGRDNIHSNIKSHHRGQRRKDVPGSSKKNYLKKETRECREAKKVVEAQKRRERARRFSSFTSWMPDLCRVWAPKQAKNSRDKADQQKRMAKRELYDTVRHQQGRIYSVRCRGTVSMILRRWDPGIDSKSPIHVVCSPKVDVGKKGKQDRDLTRSSSEDLHGSGLDKGRKRSGRWRKSSILSNWIWIWISVTIKAISQIRRGVSPVDLKMRSRRIVKYLQRNFRNFSSIGIRKVRIQFRASFRFLEISDYVIVGWVEIFGINFQRFGNNGIVVNIVTVFVEERKVLVVEDGMDLDETDNMVHTGKGIEEFENDSQKVSDEEIGEDDRVKEDGVDTIAEEKQGDEAEENDQVAGELVKKQGASKRQFKSTVGAGGSYVLSSQRKALAKEIVLTSWRRRDYIEVPLIMKWKLELKGEMGKWNDDH